jgi:subtilisin-like proprotein convertase family protein
LKGLKIIPVKVAIPPNYSETKVDLPEEQTGICIGSPAPLDGKAYTEIWEDEPFVYEVIEDQDPGNPFDDTDPYSSVLTFDEFPNDSVYTTGKIDSIGVSLLHSNMGDVKISLSCEAGNTVVLKDYDAANNATLGDTSVLVNEPYLYYWSASSTSGTMNSSSTLQTIPNDDAFLPDESFDNLLGCSLNGNWTITIEDNQVTDSGYVYSWSMIFQEDILPDVWTFRDTLVEYNVINDIIYGTYWSGENVDISGGIQVIGDTINHRAYGVPERIYGNNDYDFHVITNWGCPQDTTIMVKVEEVTFTAEKNPVEAVIDSVTFTNETSWAAERHWDYGDDNSNLVVNPDSTTIYHVYEEKGEYKAILTVTDESGCEDTASILITVIVEPSKLEEVPNMFSPGGGDVNEVFKISKESLQGMEEFLMIIYSRWGDIVYKTESMDEIINVGWNGKIRIGSANNKGPLAAPGIYFYVIRATGKDEIEYKGDRGSKKNKTPDPNVITTESKGSIHLFR